MFMVHNLVTLIKGLLEITCSQVWTMKLYPLSAMPPVRSNKWGASSNCDKVAAVIRWRDNCSCSHATCINPPNMLRAQTFTPYSQTSCNPAIRTHLTMVRLNCTHPSYQNPKELHTWIVSAQFWDKNPEFKIQNINKKMIHTRELDSGARVPQSNPNL